MDWLLKNTLEACLGLLAFGWHESATVDTDARATPPVRAFHGRRRRYGGAMMPLYRGVEDRGHQRMRIMPLGGVGWGWGRGGACGRLR